MIYDIIGDIHGCADKLEDLLLKLKYRMRDGIYQREGKDRVAVFVGDLIDRGTQNRRVIEIVRAMVEHGSAHAVMGNHEYNAICYHTPHPDRKTDWLRPHTKSKFKQHENFLKEYPLGQEDTNEVIAWFKTLPLYKEFDGFRVIHGCWDQEIIEQVKQYINDNNTLKEKYLAESATKTSEPMSLYNAIERLLKGAEVKLPEGYSFKDKDGKARHHIRVKWWGQTGASYQDLAFGYDDEVIRSFPDDQSPDKSSIPFYADDEKNKPVFFGHYWMVGTPELQQNNVCCVDYSAGKGEKLVCYSLENPKDGGSSNKLKKGNFKWDEGLR